MSPTSYQAALPRVIPSLLSATLIIIPYSNGFVKRVRKVFLQQKQRMKTRLLTFFPENQQPRQFTPLREGRRPCPHQHCSRSCYFNSRPSARCDLPADCRACLIAFQFTPLREGRRRRRVQRPDAHGISIHAPPRGATRRSLPTWSRNDFNSRPSARGDDVSKGTLIYKVVFQFTPLREGRHGVRLVLAVRPISIHAPPRGATKQDNTVPSQQSYFNSRPSARGDFAKR